MSHIKKTNLGLIIVLAIMSFFVFGCEKTTPVNDIYFSLSDGKQIVLMVGQTLDMEDRIGVTPSYATNRRYSLTSFDESVVKIQDNDLVAVAEGVTQIRVVSEDNNLKEDLMTVVVKKTKTTLKAPLNLKYDNLTKAFTFDAVTYASSYTFMINGDEYDLGNSTVFNLNQYRGQVSDSLLVVKVKANAPSYTYALESSDYSDEYKIYQAGEIENLSIKNGVLEFEKTKRELDAHIYLKSNLIENLDNEKKIYISVRDLDENFTNSSIKVRVLSVVSDDVKQEYGNDVEYFNSAEKELELKVLDVPNITFGVGEISWQNIAYASGYEIFVDNTSVAQTQNNYFNLNELANYDELFTEGVNHEIRVDATIGAQTENVGKTSKLSVIHVRRLDETEVQCRGTKVEWEAVDGAHYYNVELVDGVGTTKFTTTLTSYDMSKYLHGNYVIYVQAVGDIVANQEDDYILASKNTEFEFIKLEKIQAYVEDYVLKAINLGTGSCEVDFDVDYLDQTLDGTKGNTIDLSKEEFEPGPHSITLKRAGDNTSIESDITTWSFTQLEKVTELKIEDGVARVQRNKNNENANIWLKMQGGTLQSPIRFEVDELALNSTDPLKDYWLGAGEYKISVQVYGDGKNIFSYREMKGENYVVVDCLEVGFEVLAVPTLMINDTAKAELSIQEIENAVDYNVCIVDGETTTKLDGREFELENGETIYFSVQAKGNAKNTAPDGSMIPCYLDSCYSELISVTRLEEPTLIYNSSTQVVSKPDTSDVDFVAGYVFTHNGVENSTYDFASKFEMTESSVLTLTNLAKSSDDDINYYLNSFTYELNLNKISNDSNIYLDENNNLIIEPQDHEIEYLLYVKFNLGGITYEFNSQGGQLISDDIQLNYSYVDGKYIITIIENHNTVIEDMADNFSVDVQFIKESTGEDTTINSEIVSQDLSLVSLDSTSTIVVDENNRLVISPTNTKKEIGLVVEVNNMAQASNITLKSNGENNLVSEDGLINLPYEYDADKNVYYISVLDEQFNCLNEMFKSDFKVRVQFMHNINCVATDLDGEFTERITINVQVESSMIRDLQTLKFNKWEGNQTHTFENYLLLVRNTQNNTHFTLNLTEEMTKEGYFQIDAEYVFKNIAAGNIADVHAVSVVTIENGTLAKKGGEILIQKAETLSVSSTKDNNSENNSVVVKLNTIQTQYSNKKYIFEIFNRSGGVVENLTEKIYEDVENRSGTEFSFNLDDVQIDGTIYVRAYISTADNYVDGKTIYLFNSNHSEELVFVKVGAAQNLSVSDNVLTFDPVANAVGYEVYYWESSESSYKKLNTSLLVTNRYENLLVEDKTKLYVKAIAKDGGYTNSNLSTEITVYGIELNNVRVEGGQFKLDLKMPTNIFESLVSGEHGIVKLTAIINGSKELDLKEAISSKKITLSFNIITLTITVACDPELVLAYAEDNAQNMLEEDVNFKIKVEPIETPENVFYLNSETININDCYGLFKPVNIKKNGAEQVETITWEKSSKNVFEGRPVAERYIIKIEYTNGETKTYYSSDVNLKYYETESETYKSYESTISGTSIPFPRGYDEGNDGILDVMFGAGTYKISVQAVPVGVAAGDNICSSKFSNEYEFEILEKLVVKVNKGQLVWNKLNSAEKYQVYLYQGDSENPIIVETTNDFYDFEDKTDDIAALSGVLKVEVVALGGADDYIINGEKSDPIYIYKLPSESDVTIDDGNLILETTKLFTQAKIEFVDSVTQKKYLVEHNNPNNVMTTLTNMGVTPEQGKINWQNHIGTNFAETTKSKLTIDIPDGRDYTINITLIGSGEDLSIVNSSKQINASTLKISKLAPNNYELNLGAIKFEPNELYATYEYNFETDTCIYTSNSSLNYSFNGGLSQGNEDFWKSNTTIYKIKIAHSLGETYIYAVDYYSVLYAVQEEKLDETEYKITTNNYGDFYGYVIYKCVDGKELYFNIYKNNTISLNLNNRIWYYPITENYVDDKNSFECDNTEILSINLTDGVLFTIDISMLGGDNYVNDDKQLGALNSDSQKSHKFVKYKENQISVYDGKIQFKDLLPKLFDEVKQQEVVIDYPVYRLTTGSQVFYLYYEIAGEEAARTVAEKYDESTYAIAQFYPVEIDEVNTGYLLFDLSQCVSSDIHTISLITLAGLGNAEAEPNDDSNYRLNATTASQKTISKWKDVNVTFDNGLLKFEQSNYTNVGKHYSTIYEIKITDSSGKEFIYQIDETSEGVSVDNHIVTYALPGVIDNGDEVLNINGGDIFTFNIRALSKYDDLVNINGTYLTSALACEKSSTVADLRIEDGMLKWKIPSGVEFNGALIVIEFAEGAKIINKDIHKSLRPDAMGDYCYSFEDVQYNLVNAEGSEYIQEGNNYTIKVCLKGDSESLLDSDYISLNETVTRLAKVKNITTLDGMLTWDLVEGASSYDISISGQVVNSQTNTFDISSLLLSARSYSVQIRAIGDNRVISSMISDKFDNFIQLGAVESISVSGSKVSWDKVENAEWYKIVVIYNNGESTFEDEVNSTAENVEYQIEHSFSGDYIIEVTPIGKGSDKKFNGEKCVLESTTSKPKPVSNVYFDDNKHAYIIEVDPTDIKTGDIIHILYNFVAYSSEYRSESADMTGVSRISKSQEIKCRNSQYSYSFSISEMGIYENVRIYISRADTIQSDTTEFNNAIDLKLYSYGHGTEENPYVIHTESQLLNIEHFTSSRFFLGSGINIKDADLEARLATHGAIIAKEFSGFFDGGNKNLSFVNELSFENLTSFALFGELNGATICNLTIGQEGNKTILSNIFANNQSSVINLSMIATGASNATLTNINVLNFEITISVDSGVTNRTINVRDSIYISGLVGRTTLTTIKNSTIKIDVTVNGTLKCEQYSKYLQVGGIVAEASSTNVNNANVNFSLTSANTTFNYVGGAIAFYQESVYNRYGISDSIVNFVMANTTGLNVGGLVGYARYIVVDNCEATGSCISSVNASQVNIGGIIGSTQSVIIKNSGSFIEFDLTVNNTNYKCFGAIVGKLDLYNGQQLEILNCYSQYEVKKTDIASKIMGVYGNDPEGNMKISGCYKTTDTE